MTAVRIVPTLDEVEDGHPRFGLAGEPAAVQQLALEGREEALAEGVVVGVAHGAHRGADSGLMTAEAEGDRRVLAAVIGMVHDVGGPALSDRHVERIEYEDGPEVRR